MQNWRENIRGNPLELLLLLRGVGVYKRAHLNAMGDAGELYEDFAESARRYRDGGTRRRYANANGGCGYIKTIWWQNSCLYEYFARLRA